MGAVCDVWFADQLVPFGHRHLGGDQGGFPAIAFFDDFEEIEALLVSVAMGSQIVE